MIMMIPVLVCDPTISLVLDIQLTLNNDNDNDDNDVDNVMMVPLRC